MSLPPLNVPKSIINSNVKQDDCMSLLSNINHVYIDVVALLKD